MDTNTLHELSFMFKGSEIDDGSSAHLGKAFCGNVILDAKMNERTTIGTGGIAPLLIEPSNVSSLLYALRILHSKMPFFVAGGCSNLVVSDAGFDVPVISTRALVSPPSSTLSAVSCASGTSMSSLVSYCTEKGLSGLEQFAGLPGTVGGALYMNARCFDKEISDVLLGCDYVGESNTAGDTLSAMLLEHYDMDKSQWGYKLSPFQGAGRIITSASFGVHEDDKDAIDKRCKAFIEKRRERGHFRAPSAGSVFRNNRAFSSPSGVLIDKAGLKGKTIGGAQIAPWHGNIIINTGCATSKDIEALVKEAHDSVLEQTGFDMQCEVIFCGAGY